MQKTATNFSLTEETFYEIITLGLVTKLKNMEGIIALNVEKRLPCSRLTISAWEQNNGVSLPADLKEFYASTDGFEMTWKYQITNQQGNKSNDNAVFNGEIKISALMNVRPLNFVHKQKIKNLQFSSNRSKINNISSTTLNSDENSRTNQNYNFSMAFVLSHHFNVGTICLVHHGGKEQNLLSSSDSSTLIFSIWLLDMGNNWHFLAENFSSYFRMMLVHVGLQDWQLKFTSHGLTTNCRRIAAPVIPHLLREESEENVLESDMAPNVINGNFFKICNSNPRNEKFTPTKNKKSRLHREKKN